MHLRTKPHVKAEIQQAAALLGIDETTFVISVALERARQTIEDHERTLVSAKDRAAVFLAIEDTAEPTDELRQAMLLHRKRVAQGG